MYCSLKFGGGGRPPPCPSCGAPPEITNACWRSERACASAATIRSSKWKSAMDIWYVRFYLEVIGGACRVEGRGFEPRCGTFFFPFLIYFLLSFFSLSFFFSPGFLFFLLLSIISFKLAPPLQCSSIFLVSMYVQDVERMTQYHRCTCSSVFCIGRSKFSGELTTPTLIWPHSSQADVKQIVSGKLSL